LTFNLFVQLAMKHLLGLKFRIAITASLITVLLSISSFGQVPFAGELLVSGNNVTVNGEQAANGRTILVPSTITTGPGSYATLNFGNAGRIQLAPNTTFSVDGNAAGLRGSLPMGSVTIVSATNPVTITTLSGHSVAARAGDVVLSDMTATTGTSGGGSTTKSGVNPLVYVLVAGAAAGVLVGVAGGSGGSSSGGGPVSPIV